MFRFALALAVLSLALPAAAQTPATSAPEGYRLDVRTPGSMYSTLPGPSFRPGSQTWRATLDGRRIGEADFYELVGREDLARRTRSRLVRASTLTVVGGVAALAGTMMMASSSKGSYECRSAPESCDRSLDGTQLGVGIALFGGGATLAALSVPMYRRTVRARDAAEAVRLHNAAN